MYPINTFKTLALFLGLCCAFAFANAQSPARELDPAKYQGGTISTLPGFPVYPNTGNPTQDAITYEEQKTLWVSQNRDLYNGHGPNTLLETNDAGAGNVTYRILLGTVLQPDQAIMFDTKLAANPLVVSVSTDPDANVTTVTVPSNDGVQFLQDNFNIIP